MASTKVVYCEGPKKLRGCKITHTLQWKSDLTTSTLNILMSIYTLLLSGIMYRAVLIDLISEGLILYD